jgi:hypothetical protein
LSQIPERYRKSFNVFRIDQEGGIARHFRQERFEASTECPRPWPPARHAEAFVERWRRSWRARTTIPDPVDT